MKLEDTTPMTVREQMGHETHELAEVLYRSAVRELPLPDRPLVDLLMSRLNELHGKLDQ